MSFFDQVSGSPCANCETEPQRRRDMFCSGECAREFDGYDEMTTKELRAHLFEKGRALGMCHAEAGAYEDDCMARYL